jgi:MFS transporter, OFA family, oxalate/formate antiporter
VLLPDLQTELDADSAALARVFSTSVGVFALAVLGAGQAVDRLGSARCAGLAGLLSGAGLALTAMASAPIMLHLGFGLLFGCGSGLAYSSVVTWATTSGGTGGGRPVSIVVAAYAAGPIAAAPLGSLTSTLWGWRTSVWLAAIGVTAVTLLSSRALADAAGVRTVEQHGPARSQDRPALTALWLIFLCTTAPGLFAFAYAGAIVVERGLAASSAGAVIAFMGAGNVAGRLLAGTLADRLGLRTVLRLDLALLGVVLLALGWLPGPEAIALGLPLLALQYGAISSLLPPAVRHASRADRFGTAYGWVFTSWGVAGLLAPRLHDPSVDYATTFRWGLLATGTAFLALALHERRLAADRTG